MNFNFKLKLHEPTKHSMNRLDAIIITRHATGRSLSLLQAKELIDNNFPHNINPREFGLFIADAVKQFNK